MKEHVEVFDFPSISFKKRGVFIVNFIGNELDSKAIIHKGRLMLMNDHVTGRNCVILDENNNIL